MLGTRGCRLGILYPEIYEMQVEAIFDAAVAVRERSGEAPHLEVMIPLVDYEAELEILRKLVVDAAQDRGLASRHRLHRRNDDRAAAGLLPGRPDRQRGRLLLVRHQRPDADRARLLARRRRVEVHAASTSSARSSTAPRSRRSTRRASASWCGWPPGSGRKTKPDLKLGVCGEHGGDPDSIDFFHHSGIDYVSCSPYRVPIARVAAARAAAKARVAPEG